MKVKLRLFAYLRETLGLEEEEIDIREGEKVSDLWNRFKHKIPGNKNFRVLFAVNGEYVEEDRELKEGDEVAFIPPVSGG
jgi:molybdopterin synthase sulfur carrier subunit